MLAVLTRADQPHAFNVLMRIYEGFCEDGTCALNAAPKVWDEIRKQDLTEAFWDLMERTFGYRQEQPTLSDLLIRLLVTDLSIALRQDLPTSLGHFKLGHSKQVGTAAVFLSSWRGNSQYSATYDELSRTVEQELNIQDAIRGVNVAALAEAQTFEVIETHICRLLRDELVEGSVSSEAFVSLLRIRCDGHWVRRPSDGVFLDYGVVYRALEAAFEILALRRQYEDGLSYPSARK